MADLTETDRIEHDLAQTRARMDGRLDELQEHLTPKQMINDTFAYFRGDSGADFTKDLAARVRANPVPVALAGIGVAWLMASGQTQANVDMKPAEPNDALEMRLRIAESCVARLDHDDDDSYSARLNDVRGSIVGVARTATDTAASYAQRIKDALASAAQSTREKAHDLNSGATDTMGRFGDNVSKSGAALQEGTQYMANSAKETFASVTSNPFALGAIAVVVGAIAGALIPTLEGEEAALGSVATKVRTSGRDLAQDVVDKSSHIADETLAAVKDSAGAHGLSGDKPIGELLSDAKSGNLVDSVKQVAQETMQAGKDSAEAHLSGTTSEGSVRDVPVFNGSA